MNSVNISSIKIWGIMSGFLIPLSKFWGYLAMWHFMTFFLLLLYTVNNTFQDVAQLPPMWFTQQQNYRSRECLQGLLPTQSSPSQVCAVVWRQIYIWNYDGVCFVFRFLSATAVLSQAPWEHSLSRSSYRETLFLDFWSNYIDPMIRKILRWERGRAKGGLREKRKTWREKRPLGEKEMEEGEG